MACMSDATADADSSHAYAHDDARGELRRVLASSQFDASERNRRFLEYIVEETLSGRGDRIKAYNIATIVFGRDASFDPQIDPVVRMEAGRLRRSLERFYFVEASGAPLRIELPKGRYVPRFLQAAGDRWTAAGPHVDQSATGNSLFGSPFLAEGAVGASGYRHDAFTRRLLVGLSRFPEIGVFTSGIDDPAAPRARLVLAGDVTMGDGTLTVTATLVHARSGKVLWGGSLAGATGDGDRIADRLVRILASPDGVLGLDHGLDGEALPPDHDSASGLMRSLHRFRKAPHRDAFAAVRASLEHATRDSPEDAEALACLSQLHADAYRFRLAPAKAPSSRWLAADFARRAVDADPYSSRAWHALGMSHSLADEQKAAIGALHRAVTLNPNSVEAIADLGMLLCLAGEWQRGVASIEDALSCGRFNPVLPRLMLSLRHFCLGDFEAALSEARQVQSRQVAACFLLQAIALDALGRTADAAEAVGRIMDIDAEYADHPLCEFGLPARDPAVDRAIGQAMRLAVGGADADALRPAHAARQRRAGNTQMRREGRIRRPENRSAEYSNLRPEP